MNTHWRHLVFDHYYRLYLIFRPEDWRSARRSFPFTRENMGDNMGDNVAAMVNLAVRQRLARR